MRITVLVRFCLCLFSFILVLLQFYKDGYTSSSGAFDYAALSTDELSRTQRFAILVLSEEHGSVVLTAAPPKA